MNISKSIREIMDVERHRWSKPYEVKESRTTFWLGTFGGFRRRYIIWFEGTKILTFHYKEEADTVAAAMNGAYNLGKSHMANVVEWCALRNSLSA